MFKNSLFKKVKTIRAYGILKQVIKHLRPREANDL